MVNKWIELQLSQPLKIHIPTQIWLYTIKNLLKCKMSITIILRKRYLVSRLCTDYDTVALASFKMWIWEPEGRVTDTTSTPRCTGKHFPCGFRLACMQSFMYGPAKGPWSKLTPLFWTPCFLRRRTIAQLQANMTVCLSCSVIVIWDKSFCPGRQIQYFWNSLMLGWLIASRGVCR